MYLSTDYMIACCHELDLYLLEQDPVRHAEMLLPASIPDKFGSPLLSSEQTFESRRDAWALAVETARILDYVRDITLLVTANSKTVSGAKKVQATASWLHDRIKGTPTPLITAASPDDDIIHAMIRAAALIYTWSIRQRTPMSQFEDPALHHDLRIRWPRVSMERWKNMAGISQWILLVACPGSGTDRRAKFLRRKMGVTGMSIGMEAFPLAITYCKTFWQVQRWIAGAAIEVDGEAWASDRVDTIPG
jgi:hypothetical protein